jgi:hypothetical protein
MQKKQGEETATILSISEFLHGEHLTKSCFDFAFLFVYKRGVHFIASRHTHKETIQYTSYPSPQLGNNSLLTTAMITGKKIPLLITPSRPKHVQTDALAPCLVLKQTLLLSGPARKGKS